jgi:membrane-associated protease RseP (regulator of RpoE activity)
MQIARFRQLASAFGLVAVVLGSGALAQEATQRTGEYLTPPGPAGERQQLEVILDPDAKSSQQKGRPVERLNVHFANQEELGYWVGLQLDPVPDVLRSQMQLAEDEGLIVTELFPDTPAVKVKFEKHDVIVQVDGKPVKDVDAFNKLVQETKGEKELAISLFRHGVHQVIKVTPAKRPGERTFALAVEPNDVQNDVLLQFVPKGIDPGHPMRVEFFNPGVVVGNEFALEFGDLPKNLSIAISKAGDAPAKISVSRDEQKWEVTDKELDKLPEDIREHVKRMLRPGRGAPRTTHVRPHIEFVRPGVVVPRAVPALPPVGVAPPAAVAPVPVAPGGDVDKRLEVMNQQLEQLQKALNALIEQQGKNAEPTPQQ